MHLLQTSPNSIANSSISLDDEGLFWDSDGLDLISSLLSSSSSLVSSSFALVESFSSEEDFFFGTISSSSSVLLVVPDFKRFVGGGLALVVDGADRFFYWEKNEWKRNNSKEKRTGNGWGEFDFVCRSIFESDEEDSGEF